MNTKTSGGKAPPPHGHSSTLTGEPPRECPKCRSKRIEFRADAASFIFGGKNPVEWVCGKCGHKWKAMLP